MSSARDDYEAARSELARRGVGIRTARYDEAVFGSWFIETARPRRKLVWDGKDGLLVVQAKSLFGWNDRWVAAPNERQLIETALSHLI